MKVVRLAALVALKPSAGKALKESIVRLLSGAKPQRSQFKAALPAPFLGLAASRVRVNEAVGVNNREDGESEGREKSIVQITG